MLLTSTGESFLQLIVVLVIFVAVLALTYVTTRWIAGYQKSQMHNKNLEIVETIRLTNNKYVQIVRTGKDKYLVLGLGKDEVSLLGEISEEELYPMDSDNSAVVPKSFAETLEKMKTGFPNKKTDT